MRVPFGKHRGAELEDLDAGYLQWMADKAVHFDGSVGAWVSRNIDTIVGAVLAKTRASIGGDEPLSLNPSQTAAVESVCTDLLEGAAPFMRLEGGAGYGKSYTVRAVVLEALSRGYTVNACATSYVATQVLAAQLPGLNVRTIASLLRLAKVELEDREEYDTTSDTFDALRVLLGPDRLLVVDEYSMVGDEIGELMLEAAASCGGKLLAVGDLKQLPPVKQSTPSVLATIPAGTELTQPMRYSADSDLYRLEQAVRHEGHLRAAEWADAEGVMLHEDSASLLDAFVNAHAEAPAETHRVLFFRRADVLAWNQAIRKRFFGGEAVNPICEDERLMVMSTGDLPNGKREADARLNSRRFYSGQNLAVESVHEGEVKGVPCFLVKFEGDDHPYPVIFASGTSHTLTGSRGAEEFKLRLRELREEALDTGDWKPWRALKNSFVQVGYNYAMTVHRCQGQTVDRVFFIPSALSAGSMTSHLLYVAATRARREVHMAID